MMETRLRATAEQFLTLLEFMECHGDLAAIYLGGPQGRIKADRLWIELGTIINSVPGGVHRAAEKWKKVWADWKNKTKTKAILIKRLESGIAGGPSSRPNLTTYEERVLAIMRKNVVSDQSIIREHGYSDPSQSLSSPPQAVTPPPATHQQDTTAFELAVSDESVAMSPPALETPPPSTSCQPPRSNISAQTSPPHRDLSASRRSKVEPALSAPSTPRSTSRQRSLSTPGSRVTVASSSHMPRRVRRRRTVAPLDRTMGELVALKQQRLRMEEQRDRQLHERETRRIEVDHERNQILRSFADIARAWVDHCRNKGNTERMGSHQMTRRKEVDQERNRIMRSFADIAHAWVDHYRSKDNTERLEN